MKTYPNPADDILNVKYEQTNNRNARFRIFDISGQVISDIKADQDHFQFSLIGYKPGLYFMQLDDGEDQYYGRFIKME